MFSTYESQKIVPNPGITLLIQTPQISHITSKPNYYEIKKNSSIKYQWYYSKKKNPWCNNLSIKKKVIQLKKKKKDAEIMTETTKADIEN